MSVAGCDSLHYTNLAVQATYSDTVQVRICSGASYMAGGSLQTVAGMYVDSFVSIAGCDSLHYTNLAVQATYSDTVQVRICSGASYMAGGFLQTVAGMYVDSFVSVAGCDSWHYTNLAVQATYSDTVQVSICSETGSVAGGD